MILKIKHNSKKTTIIDNIASMELEIIDTTKYHDTQGVLKDGQEYTFCGCFMNYQKSIRNPALKIIIDCKAYVCNDNGHIIQIIPSLKKGRQRPDMDKE